MTSTTATKYNYSLWRRKESTAVVKLFPKGTWKFNVVKWTVNKSLKEYFGWHNYLLEDALFPFYILWNDAINKFDAEIVVRWWGIRGQADSIRLGFSRALVEYNEEFKLQLKPHGLLKRDPRIKERKKPWLRKARRSPQWSKR